MDLIEHTPNVTDNMWLYIYVQICSPLYDALVIL
jgi:hypothetical protein